MSETPEYVTFLRDKGWGVEEDLTCPGTWWVNPPGTTWPPEVLSLSRVEEFAKVKGYSPSKQGAPA